MKQTHALPRTKIRTGEIMYACLAALLVSAPGPALCGEPAAGLGLPVLLPDGTAYKTWEAPLTFTRTYTVDCGNPLASDDNPGTVRQPFKTINRAAEVLRPGEQVIVKPGVYREWVRPARGGAGPEKMIGFEADGEVVVKGSMLVPTNAWQASSVPRTSGRSNALRVWKLRMKPEWFGDYNPFALRNEPGDRVWGFFSEVYALKRGLVFQQGRRLMQVATVSSLLGTAGTYCVDDELTLLVRPFGDVAPSGEAFEITTQAEVFAPEIPGLGYIRVKGFAFEHAAHQFPVPRQAVLSTSRGHHWIIESNTVRQASATGIAAGHFAGRFPRDTVSKSHISGFDIIRGNTVEDCGMCGIGLCDDQGPEDRPIGTLVEDNTILRTGWQAAEVRLEAAAVKMHNSRGCLIRGNLIQDTYQASGIWLDWTTDNVRVTRNTILNTQTIRGAIYVEAVLVPNMVDHNVVWGCAISRDPKAYTRDFGGVGILTDTSQQLVVAHNLVGRCRLAAILMGRGNPKRRVTGRLPTASDHRVWGNMIFDSGRGMVVSLKENVCDYNLYGIGGAPFYLEISETLMDFASWQRETGFGAHSRRGAFDATVDPRALTLTLSTDGKDAAMCVPALDGCARDFHGRPRPRKSAPGPFAELPASGTIVNIDPRRR